MKASLPVDPVAAPLRAIPPAPWWNDFVCGGLGTVGACFFSNPLEVVKTRLQLQGELERSSSHAPPGGGAAAARRPYRGIAHALYTIATTEGVFALQKGLTTACLYQFTMNSMRLGAYSTLKQLLHGGEDANSYSFFFKNVLCGATAGVLGATVASPFFLVKVRMQNRTNVASNVVSTQYDYTSTWDAFKKIVKERGFAGLWQGTQAAALRVGVGSSVQLSSYDQAKRVLLSTGFVQDNWMGHLAASLVSGWVVTTFMNPLDVVSTRMYNQQHGPDARYKNPFDCISKIARTEGVRGFYKGFLAHYFRLAPHTVCTFVFWEQLKLLSTKIRVRYYSDSTTGV